MLVLHPCSQFLNQFLAKRNLSQSTGKPLYAYKTSQAEYEALKAVLRNAPLLDSTAACFVLFAAEWWRRSYSGGHWEWEPIFQAIDQPGWNTPARRYTLMTSGCRHWRREVFQHEDGPNSYLGTLFFESGIPVGLFHEEGRMRALVLRVFQQLQSQVCENEFELIRNTAQALLLPTVLNVEPFYQLIHNVVQTLLALKTEFDLGREAEPLAYLTKQFPSWRDRLPLRIDDDARASRFLDALLNDVSKIAKPEASKIGLQHTLRQSAQGWQIRTTLAIPDGFHQPASLQLDESEFETLSPRVGLKIVYDGQERLIGYGFKTSNNQLSIRNLSNYTLPATLHATPWSLVFADSQTDRQLPVTLPYSDGFDTQLPWVFTHQDENRALLKGFGSTRLAANRALVVCPNDFKLEAPAGTVINRGPFSASQTVYELTSTCLIQDAQEGQVFRIRLSQPADDENYVTLYPQANTKHIPFYPKQNAGIFVGFPRIRKWHKLTGVFSANRDTLQYKAEPSEGWQTVNDVAKLTGRFKIRTIGPEGEVAFCREIAVLPADFAVRFDAVHQQIYLDHTEDFTISVFQEGLPLEAGIGREGSGHCVRIQTGNPGHGMRFRLMRGQAKAITLQVPFPAASGQFVDREGQMMTNNQTIDLQRLYGAQLVLNNVSAQPQIHPISLTLSSIHDRDATQYTIRKTVKVPPFSSREVSLLHYKAEIEQLLSFSSNIDASVRLQYKGGTSLCVKQYTYQAHHDPQTQRITLDGGIAETASVRIRAFPLAERFGDETCVDLISREDGWAFPENRATQGKWFYFSTKDSSINLRPSVAKLISDGDEDTRELIDEIHEASNHSYGNRQTVLTKLFDRIAGDFGNINWITLQHLRKQTDHLPLNALDVWKALVRSESGLVSFFLLYDSPMIAKLSQEFSVNWHGLSVSAWLRGFRDYRAYLPASIADLVLNQKLQELEAGFLLGSLVQIIRLSVLEEVAKPDFQLCRHQVSIQPLLADEIMGRQGFSGLIQKHTDHPFPTYLHQELVSLFNRLPEGIKNLLPDLRTNFRYIRPVVYLPVLLACQSVCPTSEVDLSHLNRHQMMQLIDFDEAFFKLVYNVILAHYWFTHSC